MSTKKTAISLDEGLFAEADALAEEMRISRSKLIALAVEEFILRHQNQELLDQINEAYADETDEGERIRLQGMRRRHRAVIETESP